MVVRHHIRSMQSDELVRQLEIVTVRNPDLARHVKSVFRFFFESFIVHLTFVSLVNSYLDIFIPEYSYGTVIPELASCMSLFSNLHTVHDC